MADYNLGRAHGEIEITADTRGAQEAQAAMATTAAEAEVLDKSMGRVNDQFETNRQRNVASAEAIVRHRQQVEDLQRTYGRYHDEYQRAVNRTKEAEDALTRARTAEDTETNVLLRLARDVQRARDSEERLLARVEQAHARYQTRLASVRQELNTFNEAHIKATSGLNMMRLEAERAGESLEKLSSQLSSVLRIVGRGGIMGLLGLSSASSATTMGAAGLSGITNVLSGVMETVQQLSGVLALLPAMISGGVVALGTLAVGFHGVSESLGSMGDVNKFIDSLKELAPAARQAMEILYSFNDAFRGARQAIQQSIFAPIIADLQPLIYTWLPQLMRAGEAVGSQFGQMAHQVFQILQLPSTQAGFNTFIQNMVTGLRSASGAIQPLMQAWQTLSVVGSGFFERIGNAITQVAGEFNRWVEQAASSGRLQAWISSALTGFTNLARTVLNVTEAVGNILSIGDKYGGGFLQFIRTLSEEFKNWTVSDRGRQTLTNFFQLIESAGAAVHPILRLIGEGLATVGGTLTRLGIQIAPAVNSFFQSIVQALQTLAPQIQQAGPAISEFIVELGRVILQIVQQAGPELPRIFKGLADALIALAPILPRVVAGIADILDHLSADEIRNIFEAAVALKALTVAAGALIAILDVSPIVLIIGAIAALAAGVVYAYNHFQSFHDFVNTVWQNLRNFGTWIGNEFVGAWHAIGNAVQGFLNTLGGIGSTISSALGGAWTNISTTVGSWLGQASSWGTTLIQNMINGIRDMIPNVGGIMHDVMQTIRDHLPGSRAKLGPFAQQSPEEIGTSTAQGYAAGLSGGSGAVGSAAAGVAGQAAGTTGLGFTSAGATGTSGGGVQGHSGFDQYINFLTNDLRNWNSIFQKAFSIVQDFSSTIVQTVNVVASIWGRGDNPLTRPGGIAGPPVRQGQQGVPGVPSVQQPGKPPIPALAPLGGPPPAQQGVPGVPNVDPRGQGYVPGSAGTGNVLGPPAAPPPAPAVGAAPPAPGDTPLVSALKGKGFNDQQIRLIQGFSQVEGNNPAGNPTLGFTDSQLGGASDLQSHVDALAQQFKDRASVAGAFPQGGTDQEQAQWIARVVGQNGSPSDWQGNAQPQDYVQRVQAAMQGIPRGQAPPPAQGRPGGGAVFGQQRPGVEQNTGGATPEPAAENISAIIQTLFPQIQTIGGVHPDALSYHPSGHALDIMIPGWDTPQGQALGAQINDFLGRNAGALGISDRIYRGQYYATGQDPTAYQYQGPDPNQRHDTHIHVTTMGPGGGGGPEPSNFQRDITQLQGLPPSFVPPAALTPGVDGGGVGGISNSDGGTGITRADIQGGAVAAGALGLGVIGIRTGLKVRGYNRTIRDAEGRLSDMRELEALRNRPTTGGPRPSVLEPAPINDALFGDLSQTMGPEELARLRGAGPFTAPGAAYQPPLPGMPGGQFGEVAGRAPASVVGSAPAGVARGQLGLPGIPDQNPFENMGGGTATGRSPWAVRYDLLDDLQKTQVSDMMRNGGLVGNAKPIMDVLFAPDHPAGPMGSLIGEVGPGMSGWGQPAGPGAFATGINTAIGAATMPFFISGIQNQINQGVGFGSVRTPAVDPSRRGMVSTGAAGAIGTGAITGGSAVTGIGLGVVGGIGAVGAAGLGALSTATGAATGQEPRVDYTRRGGAPAPNFTTYDAAGNPVSTARAATPPSPPPTRPTSVIGDAGRGAGADSLYGPVTGTTIGPARQAPPPATGASAGSTPVHVTNPGDLPGGPGAPPGRLPGSAATPGPPSISTPVALRAVQAPAAVPQAGQPQSYWGYTVPGQQESQTQGEQAVAGNAAPSGKLPFNAQSPIQAFSSSMAAVGNIGTDAFQIFSDVIDNITATAKIGDTLVRGAANTEDVIGVIQNLQTFLKTGADIAHLVSDVGGVVAGAGAGDPTGGAGAVGGGIQAIGSIVSSALSIANNVISLGIEVYHEVGKYQGILMGSLLGGPNTGLLGGNVNMLLNTATNQFETYSDDNPLNKNIRNIPLWQQSYARANPTTVQVQQNLYVGPGQTPQQNMSDQMWMVNVGGASVASVAGIS